MLILGAAFYCFTSFCITLIFFREVENLIKNGAEVNKLLDDGFSCFHKVVGISQVSEKYVLPLVSLMLDYSGDPNIK